MSSKGAFCVSKKQQNSSFLSRRSPGGILFSSVAGGPPHVHSPDRYSGNGTTKYIQDKCGRDVNPVSLFNSLLDPDIELPTISVREVDEILSSLTSPDTTPIKSTGDNPNLTMGQNSYCDTCDNPCQNSLQYNKKGSSTITVKEPDVIKHSVASNSRTYIKGVEVDRVSVSSDVYRNAVFSNSSSIPTTENSLGSICTLESPILQSSGLSPDRERCVDSKDSIHHKRSIKTVSLQSMMDILPLFPSCKSVAELGALALGPEFDEAAIHSCRKQKSPNLSLRSKACSGTNLCNLPPKVPVSTALRDRSPIGILDLATHGAYQNYSNVSHVQEATKYRQAYLSVRRANRAKILSKSTTSALSFFENGSSGKSSSQHVSYQASNSDQPTVHSRTTLSKPSIRSTSTTSDDRFKHICPHPRCGRRYQAEIGLLRHLVKYHGEQIELPRRTRSAANQHLVRRPASEERTITSTGFDEIDVLDKSFLNQEVSRNEIPCLFGSKSILQPDQTEMKEIDFNPSSVVTFETNKAKGYTSNESYAKLKDIPSVSNTGVSLMCSASPAGGNGTIVPIPLIDLGTDVCSSTLPITVEMDSSNSHGNLHPSHGQASLQVLKPMRKQPRLRSVSGSHSDSPIGKHLSNSDQNSTNQCKHHPPSNSSGLLVSHSLNSSMTYTNTVDSQKDGNGDNGRRRTLSTGHDPRVTDVDEDNMGSKCPSCGYADWKLFKTKEREWISGVHALSCSKTDCVSCPVDNCTYVCSGRADLSAHLTSIHFPEIQHQLVRLIFACPLKDCQIICSDEASFQAHFIAHLHGHLPGNLAELFNPSSLTSPVTMSVTPMLSSSDTTSGMTTPPVVVSSTPVVESMMDSCSETSQPSSNISYGQPSHFVTGYTAYLSMVNQDEALSTSSASEKYHITLMDIQPGLVTESNSISNTSGKPTSSNSIHSHSKITVAAAADLIPAIPMTSLDSSDSMTLSENHHQSSLSVSSHYAHDHHQEQFTELPNSPSLFTNDDSIATLPVFFKSNCDPVDTVSNNFSNVSNSETDHVDLTDNRNLLSALDLIPDDILIELLKEDRASLWGEPVTNNNNNTNSGGSLGAVNSALSAPYNCYPEYSCVVNTDNPPVKTTISNDSVNLNYDPCDKSSVHDSVEWIDFDLTGSVSPLNESSVSYENLHKEDSSNLLSDDSSSWIPSNLVHHTWSSAIANEKVSNSTADYDDDDDNCSNASSRYFIGRHFNCPHRVISDLTAALILPDVERRLKATISATRTKKFNLPSTSTVCSSVSSQASSRNTFRTTYQSCCSGKRRRNASESPPLSTYETTVASIDVKPSLKIDSHQSLDCWKWNMDDNGVISPDTVKCLHDLKTASSINREDSNNNSKMNNIHSNEQEAFKPNLIDKYNGNFNHIKINGIQKPEEHGKQHQQQTLVKSNDKISLFSTTYHLHEPRKRLKKNQKASTLAHQAYFTPYSIDKYIIPRPVLPRRHSMATYNFIRSDCYSHLPHS
ncbi:unnamed protein product [Heterobilharzia americana]|nr:unnamed protein product [Heterobilharzia americana]